MKPIRTQNATSMRSITALAAAGFVRENHPTNVSDGNLLAGCGLVGSHSAANQVVSSVGSIHSLPVVCRVIDELSVDLVSSFVDDEGFIEVDLIGVVIVGRVFCQDAKCQSTEQ